MHVYLVLTLMRLSTYVCWTRCSLTWFWINVSRLTFLHVSVGRDVCWPGFEWMCTGYLFYICLLDEDGQWTGIGWMCRGYFFYIWLLDEMNIDLVFTECAQANFSTYVYWQDTCWPSLDWMCTGYFSYIYLLDEMRDNLVLIECAHVIFSTYACLTRCLLTWFWLNVHRLPFPNMSIDEICVGLVLTECAQAAFSKYALIVLYKRSTGPEMHNSHRTY